MVIHSFFKKQLSNVLFILLSILVLALIFARESVTLINGEQLYMLIEIFLFSLFALPYAIYDVAVNFSLQKLYNLMVFILAVTPVIFIIQYGIKTRSTFVGKSIIGAGLFLFSLISMIGMFFIGCST